MKSTKQSMIDDLTVRLMRVEEERNKLRTWLVADLREVLELDRTKPDHHLTNTYLIKKNAARLNELERFSFSL